MSGELNYIWQWLESGGPVMLLLFTMGWFVFYALLMTWSTPPKQARLHQQSLLRMAVICPSLGLLGTVAGMGEIFSALAGDAGTLAGGIKVALSTTQYGLSLSAIALCGAWLARMFGRTA